ncbi:hypothetical protein AWJ20_2363 [Sugiyamaella lignohabitans]|uniref:CHY-type domain-containing protein n=1 Tax=Sugiyamaella lignohabitans TaxID=796027 RepID=A0A167F2V7_9ASCO|nr:uncharacterized protein AWJ20_2363 [Sugiyamaella lignohabitans]ANB14756.1 hypothetical protein AWJ20_2363 [Sugiyamaella lignohabitans]
MEQASATVEVAGREGTSRRRRPPRKKPEAGSVADSQNGPSIDGSNGTGNSSSRRGPGRNQGQNSRRNAKSNAQNGSSGETATAGPGSESTSEVSKSNGGPRHGKQSRPRNNRNQKQGSENGLSNRDSSKNSRKPTPRVSKRDQELSQVLELYGIADSAGDAGSTSGSTSTPAYTLALAPSDPDFPFDMDFLIFRFYLPLDYPVSRPWISVENSDIPKGYSANVEMGFRQIATKATKNPNLMKMLQELNTNLETFLKMEKQQTIKIVKHKQVAKTGDSRANDGSSAGAGSGGVSSSATSPSPQTTNGSAFNPMKMSFVPKAMSDKRKRQMDILIKRLGDVCQYNPQASTSQIKVTITPAHSEILPETLNTPFVVTLKVPEDYGISPCTITLPNNDDASFNVMNNFNAHAKAVMKSWSLLALMNYLTVELESLMLPSWVSDKQKSQLAAQETAQKVKNTESSTPIESKSETVNEVGEVTATVDTAISTTSNTAEETSKVDADSVSDSDVDSRSPESDADSDSESDSDDEDKTYTTKSTNSGLASDQLKKTGTAVDLIDIQMTNIGFLECHALSLVLACNKCKTENEVHNVVSGPYGRESKATPLRCEKCNSLLAVAFRKNFLHSHSNNAGYLDLSGCSAADILPSAFSPTCGQCTTSWPQAFRRVEFGRVNNFNCRECHAKLSLLIPGFSFDVISTENLAKDRINANLAKRKDKTQSLGLVGGTPLPNNGSCQHYKKSNRWFRFSCCSKVYPCDRCHDEKANHPNERAHRMICGKCSREQNFSDVCLFCRHSFDNKHSPFWEGGKGTRDKVKMSRKDPHKYKRVKN